jgi:hypothetical protein
MVTKSKKFGQLRSNGPELWEIDYSFIIFLPFKHQHKLRGKRDSGDLVELTLI